MSFKAKAAGTLLAGTAVLGGAKLANDHIPRAEMPGFDVGIGAFGQNDFYNGRGEPTLAERVEDGVKNLVTAETRAESLMSEVAEGCGAIALETAINTPIFDQEGKLVELTPEELASAQGNIAETTFDFCMDERAEGLSLLDVSISTDAYNAEAFTAQIEAISN